MAGKRVLGMASAIAVCLALSACGAAVHKPIRQQALGYLGPETVAASHACGRLAVGVGWRVHASSGPSCDVARQVAGRFLVRCHRTQRHPGTTCGVLGYSCVELLGFKGEDAFWCATAIRSVSAVSDA